MFPTNIWTALFEKETWKEKPPSLKLVKCREFEGRIRWNESCPFHDITGFTLTLLEKVRRTEDSFLKVRRIETLSGSKFDPATGVTQKPTTFFYGACTSAWRNWILHALYCMLCIACSVLHAHTLFPTHKYKILKYRMRTLSHNWRAYSSSVCSLSFSLAHP